jgi:hypothetical protein
MACLRQEDTRTITFGRDRLGRRSLLINTEADTGMLTITSVSSKVENEATANGIFQEIDCSGFWQMEVDKVGLNESGGVNYWLSLLWVALASLNLAP